MARKISWREIFDWPARRSVKVMGTSTIVGASLAVPEAAKSLALIMDDPDAALKELHRAIDELKLNGVILLSNIGGKPLTAPEYRPFFAEADRMKLCILLHPMLPVNAEPFREYVLGPIVGFMFDTTLAVARMCFDGLLREFPDIRWIVAHLGGGPPPRSSAAEGVLIVVRLAELRALAGLDA